MQTLRNRKLIAREARLGPRREKLWRTTQLFLDTFGLVSLDELYQAGRMEEVFAPVYGSEMEEEAAAREEVSDTFLDAADGNKDRGGEGPVHA